MKAKNQIVIISGILALLATATIAASNIVQPANAQTSPGNSGSAYGNQVIKPNAQTGTWGSGVSSVPPGDLSASRANGCKENGHNGLFPGQSGSNPGVDCRLGP